MSRFWTFNRSRAFVRKLKIKNVAEWKKYCSSGDRPDGIPSNPNVTYKDQGWAGYADWLTDTSSLIKGKYRPFKRARSFVRILGINTVGEWRKYASSGDKPDDIPSCPYRVYADHGWVDFSDWLGIQIQEKKKFLPYEDAKKFVHKLGLTTKEEWLDYAQSKKKPYNIPVSPYDVYRYDGYVSMRDWLGAKARGAKYNVFQPFEEARTWVRKQNIANSDEWKEFTKSEKMPLDIPVAPDQHYEEWVSMPDWLGSNEVVRPRIRKDRNQTITRDFVSARRFVRKLGLKTKEEWEAYAHSGECPPDIPTCPNCYEQWIDYADWLGNNSAPSRRRKPRK